jgi:hypothetical protein
MVMLTVQPVKHKTRCLILLAIPTIQPNPKDRPDEWRRFFVGALTLLGLIVCSIPLKGLFHF